MKRAGFTMIELIFVIVILGILAAVALPKFVGVSEQAKVGKLQAYVGTLNRTVMPAYWSDSLMGGTGGLIETYDSNIRSDLPAPDSITVSFADANWAANSYDFNATEVSDAAIGSKTYNGVTYTIVCRDGNSTAAPQCDLFNGKSSKYMLHSQL